MKDDKIYLLHILQSGPEMIEEVDSNKNQNLLRMRRFSRYVAIQN